MADSGDLAADALAIASGLKKTVDELSIKVEGLLNQDVENNAGLLALADEVTQIRELIGAKEPDFLLAPWWWPNLTSDQAREAWDVLVPWVETVVIWRYDYSSDAEVGELPEGASILRCWFAHATVVDKLSALYWAWKGDYRRHAPANGPIEFQENWVPKTLGQIEKILQKCQAGCTVLKQPLSKVSWPARTHWIDADIAGRRQPSA